MAGGRASPEKYIIWAVRRSGARDELKGLTGHRAMWASPGAPCSDVGVSGYQRELNFAVLESHRPHDHLHDLTQSPAISVTPRGKRDRGRLREIAEVGPVVKLTR